VSKSVHSGQKVEVGVFKKKIAPDDTTKPLKYSRGKYIGNVDSATGKPKGQGEYKSDLNDVYIEGTWDGNKIKDATVRYTDGEHTGGFVLLLSTGEIIKSGEGTYTYYNQRGGPHGIKKITGTWDMNEIDRTKQVTITSIVKPIRGIITSYCCGFFFLKKNRKT
jgi:hypothetical protein